MHAKDAIRYCLDTSENIIKTYVGDLTDDELKTKAMDGMNPIAWQLGHLVSSERMMMEGIKPGVSPALPEGFNEVHGRDNATGVETSAFLSKEEYLRLIDAQRAATKKILDQLTEAELDGPGPERMRTFAPTVGAVLIMAGNHYMMHAGQFVATRRKASKPVVI